MISRLPLLRMSLLKMSSLEVMSGFQTVGRSERIVDCINIVVTALPDGIEFESV